MTNILQFIDVCKYFYQANQQVIALNNVNGIMYRVHGCCPQIAIFITKARATKSLFIPHNFRPY